MSDYKWITFSNTSSQKFLLSDSNFNILAFPEIHYRDELLDAKFKEHGLRVDLEFNANHDGDTICTVKPLIWKYTCITAPIYEQKEDGTYVKISDSFTAKTTDPILYGRVKSEIEICQQEVKKEQEKQFINLFDKNSLDGGKTSWMHITSSRYTGNNISFKERYVPNGFIMVCKKYDMHNPDLDSILFMKEIDAHNKTVDIIVPKDFKGLVIGKKGKNIKRIAQLVNAKRINVI